VPASVNSSNGAGFRAEREAQQELTRMLTRIDHGVLVPPDQLTVDGWLTAWLEHLELVVHRAPATIYRYRSALWTNVVPAIGGMRMQRVTAEDCNRIYRNMAQLGRSPRTTRLVYTILRKGFADAVDTDIVPVNVVERSKPPSTTAARPPILPTWTWDELNAFLDHVEDDWLGPVFTFLATTGSRRGEVCVNALVRRRPRRRHGRARPQPQRRRQRADRGRHEEPPVPPDRA
jgi:hypothetical protein